MTARALVLVAYDVAVDEDGQKRLRRVAKVCQRYGQRVQNSVFEIFLTPPERSEFVDALLREIDVRLDSVLLYELGTGDYRPTRLGKDPEFDIRDPLFL